MKYMMDVLNEMFEVSSGLFHIRLQTLAKILNILLRIKSFPIFCIVVRIFAIVSGFFNVNMKVYFVGKLHVIMTL